MLQKSRIRMFIPLNNRQRLRKVITTVPQEKIPRQKFWEFVPASTKPQEQQTHQVVLIHYIMCIT